MPDIKIRIAMPRAPFKNSLKHILSDKDIEDFITWISGEGNERELDDLNDHEKASYMEMLREHATVLAQKFPGQQKLGMGGRGFGLPYALAPSFLEGYGIKIPADYQCQIGLAEMIDDYFGICYQPRRIKERYQDSDIKERLIRAIRGQMSSPSELDIMFMGNASLADVVAIFGRQEVKKWWRNLEEGEIENIEGECPTLYDGLVDAFGGGLEEEAPIEPEVQP